MIPTDKLKEISEKNNVPLSELEEVWQEIGNIAGALKYLELVYNSQNTNRQEAIKIFIKYQ